MIRTYQKNMANIFRIRPGISEATHVRIKKEIRDRVDGCFTGDCWTLKDDEDRGQIYLEKKMVAGGGRYVQIRRYLFLVTWKYLPDRRKLIPRCHNARCVNPGHMYYKGFKPPYDIVTNLISVGWLDEQEVKQWYEG